MYAYTIKQKEVDMALLRRCLAEVRRRGTDDVDGDSPPLLGSGVNDVRRRVAEAPGSRIAARSPTRGMAPERRWALPAE
jgi:hypothetical protein